ncbi:hypothetical protein bcere0019_39260 [Bacillus cereus Rock3-28]|nr:hypothetical protein bcere0019_39260 [Bacillus cereus Rock3-28]
MFAGWAFCPVVAGTNKDSIGWNTLAIFQPPSYRTYRHYRTYKKGSQIIITQVIFINIKLTDNDESGKIIKKLCRCRMGPIQPPGPLGTVLRFSSCEMRAKWHFYMHLGRAYIPSPTYHSITHRTEHAVRIASYRHIHIHNAPTMHHHIVTSLTTTYTTTSTTAAHIPIAITLPIPLLHTGVIY